MLEILKYIFSSFWVFGGTIVLIWNIGLMFALIFYAIFGDSKKEIAYNLVQLPRKTAVQYRSKSIRKWARHKVRPICRH